MKLRAWVMLYLISAAVLLIAAVISPTPGYMDADYYFAGGLNIVNGWGWSETYIWNYLNSPAGIPQPAFTYWMPLPSFVAWFGMVLSGQSIFWLARLPFIILAASIAPLVGWLSYSFSHKPAHAWMSGLLAAASGYYLPYLTTTSTFTPAMLLGTVYVASGSELFKTAEKGTVWRKPFILGVFSGLLHLNRADGLVWLILAGVLVILAGYKAKSGISFASLFPLLAGYTVIMGAWYTRNIIEYGTFFPAGSNHSLWFTAYDDLYVLNSNILTPGRWAATGIFEIIKVRFQALGQNLLSAIAVQGEIFLTPLILVGAWRLRHSTLIKVAALIWGITLAMMTFIFPFAGMRGGFFHSGAMVQPLLWSLVPLGFESMINLGVRKRGWRVDQASKVFTIGLVVIALLFTVGIQLQRVGKTTNELSSQGSYPAAGKLLSGLKIPENEIVMVNNPPGFYVASKRPSIVIPAGGVEETLAAARQFNASYLLLDPSNDAYLGDLYTDQDGTPFFYPLGNAGNMRLFRINP